jgi:AcrR family transcriptional regulator
MQMARPSKYGAERILDAALKLLERRGLSHVTAQAVAHELGAPSGSIYHRFPSRDLLRAELWLRTVAAFQHGFISRLEESDMTYAARYVVEWSRKHPREARLLMLYRREDFISGPWPRALRARAHSLRRELNEALQRAATRAQHCRSLDLLRLTMAVVHVPYAAVAPYLSSGHPVPARLEDLVSEVARTLLRQN